MHDTTVNEHGVDDRAPIARLMRRAAFGPRPGDLDGRGLDEVCADVLGGLADDGAEMPTDEDRDVAPGIAWWLDRMVDGPAPLHDKLVLFWHSTITSSADKASGAMMIAQHNLLRRHASGNFRALLGAVVVDAAMLIYLDAAWSRAEAPNENLARELMELFTLGRGSYTEADVKAGAKILAGFTVDWDTAEVGVDEDARNHGPVEFLGESGMFSVDRMLDVVCAHPACAPFVTDKLYRFFVGTEPTEERLAELAALFTDSGLEIAPVVAAIVTSEAILDSAAGRPLLPIEWYATYCRTVGQRVGPDDLWNLELLGQLPMYPPNVAGWQVGPRWAASGLQLVRAGRAISSDDGAEVQFDAVSSGERIDSALARCGLVEIGAATRAGLELAAARFGSFGGGDQLLLALALASPEACCS